MKLELTQGQRRLIRESLEAARFHAQYTVGPQRCSNGMKRDAARKIEKIDALLDLIPGR